MPDKQPFFQWRALKKGEASALIWLWLSLLVVGLDQVTKIWASAALEFNQPVNVLPFFDLRLLHNAGAAWSILANAGGWQRWFLSGLAIIVTGVTLVIGGALGNVIDRLMYGYVIDFIDIYYQGWHWPAFNIADSAISMY